MANSDWWAVFYSSCLPAPNYVCFILSLAKTRILKGCLNLLLKKKKTSWKFPIVILKGKCHGWSIKLWFRDMGELIMDQGIIRNCKCELPLLSNGYLINWLVTRMRNVTYTENFSFIFIAAFMINENPIDFRKKSDKCISLMSD